MTEPQPTGPAEPDPHAIRRKIIHGFQCLSEAIRQTEDAEAVDRFRLPLGGVLGRIEGNDPIGTLAERVGISDEAAAEVLQLLHRTGLIRRPEGAINGEVVLTEYGQVLAAPFREKAAQYDRLLEGMFPEDRVRTLDAIIGSIRALMLEDRIVPQRLCVTCRYFRPHAHEDADQPHHCGLVDGPLGNGDLRVDCEGHDGADPDQSDRNWSWFRGGRTRP